MSKKLIFGEPAKITTLRLYSWEKELVKTFLKKIRKEKLKELNKEN